MKQIWLLIFIFVLLNINYGHAQFGVRLKYNKNQLTNLENALNQSFSSKENLFSPGYELGVDYWFRLKKKRVEFFPELAVSFAQTNFNNLPNQFSISSNSYIFNFHTQLYALDFGDDCNCPTFSKQGAGIDKGLFFHLTPGITYQNKGGEFKNNGSTIVEVNHNKTIFQLGLGAGIDFGLSELITITPIISYYFYSNDNHEISSSDDGLSIQTLDNMTRLQFTLRFGFRPDYGRKKYRR